MQCLFLMRGLNSKIGQSTVVIKTVCCFPRKALSYALLMVPWAAHVVEERAAGVQACARRRWLRCLSCKTSSSANRDESQILIRDYRWKMCRTPRDSDSGLLMHTAVLSSLGRPCCCSRTLLTELTSACYRHN